MRGEVDAEALRCRKEVVATGLDAEALGRPCLFMPINWFEGLGAMFVIDDTPCPRRACTRSGSPHDATPLGKVASCRILVPLTRASSEVPVRIAARLFLPRRWTGDERRHRDCLSAGFAAPHVGSANDDRCGLARRAAITCIPRLR